MAKRPTTKKQRDRLYKRAGLRARTPTETAAYLAMIKTQAEEFVWRHEKLAAAYAEDAERRKIDDEGKVQFPGNPDREGYCSLSLADRIAERTAALYRDVGARSDDWSDWEGFDADDEPDVHQEQPWWSLLWKWWR